MEGLMFPHIDFIIAFVLITVVAMYLNLHNRYDNKTTNEQQP